MGRSPPWKLGQVEQRVMEAAEQADQAEEVGGLHEVEIELRVHCGLAS